MIFKLGVTTFCSINIMLFRFIFIESAILPTRVLSLLTPMTMQWPPCRATVTHPEQAGFIAPRDAWPVTIQISDNSYASKFICVLLAYTVPTPITFRPTMKHFIQLRITYWPLSSFGRDPAFWGRSFYSHQGPMFECKETNFNQKP